MVADVGGQYRALSTKSSSSSSNYNTILTSDFCVLTPCCGRCVMVKFGLALGGGGAKGLAHVLMLEALDEIGLRPACVAGTSIGAVIGVLYCSGRSGREIREFILH